MGDVMLMKRIGSTTQVYKCSLTFQFETYIVKKPPITRQKSQVSIGVHEVLQCCRRCDEYNTVH